MWHLAGAWAARGIGVIGDDLAYDNILAQMARPPGGSGAPSPARTISSLVLSAGAADILNIFRDLSASNGLREPPRLSPRAPPNRSLPPPPCASSMHVSTREALRAPLLVGVAALVPLLVGLNVLVAAVYLVDGERTRTHVPHGALLAAAGWGARD